MRHALYAVSAGLLSLLFAAGAISGQATNAEVAVSNSAPEVREWKPVVLTPAGTNPATNRTERAEVFEFSAKPAVSRVGGKYVITFETKAACDATVAVVDTNGKIVRHLASGVLGRNAPWPFKQDSLSQSLEWDGKDDAGKAAPAGCRVRVGLGLSPKLDKLIGDEPRIRVNGEVLCCDAQGNLYLLNESAITVVDRDGNYVNTTWPPPATVPPEKLGFPVIKRTDGKSIPFTVGGSQFRGPAANVALFGGVWRHTPVCTPDGKELIFLMGAKPDQRYLVRLGTDGSLAAGNIVMVDSDRFTPREEMHLAVSPDGTWVYFSNGFAKNRNFAVYRRKLAELVSAPGKGVSPVAPQVFVGEPDKAGSDEKHFSAPRGVACDKDGNVYVADWGNNRIQVFTQGGKLLRSLPTASPDQLAVHPKSGNIYVLRYKYGPAGHELVILDNDGNLLTAMPVKPLRYSDADHPGSFCLDASAGEPVIWAVTGEGILKLAERGGKLEKVKNLSQEIHAPWKGWRFQVHTHKCYIVADPAREEIYFKPSGGCFPTDFMRVDGRTGKVIEYMGGGNCEELAMGADGLLYVRADNFGRYIVRYDPSTRKCVPFEKGVDFTWRAQKTKAIRVAFSSNLGCGTRTFQDGFSVAPNGDIYLIQVEAERKIVPELKKMGQGASLANEGGLLNGAPGPEFLHVYDHDGVLQCVSALPGLFHSNGVGVGRNGAVYVSLAARQAGVWPSDGIAPGQNCDNRWGTLLKFPGDFSTFPVGRIHGTWDTPAAAGKAPYSLSDCGWKPTPEGAVWTYAGISPSCSFGGGCVCYNSRFCLDGFDRAWVPASLNYSVNAIDANGNVIVRIGSYGNADSRGKDSPVIDPKTGKLRPKRADDPADLKPPAELSETVGWQSPRFVAASDEALYVNDTLNQRIYRLALSCAAEETVSMP